MKKVLIITYYWPPAGGPGVQRVLKFAKYLPEFGWQPIILTVKKGEYPAYDTSLEEDVHPDCKVYKTSSWEPAKLYKKFTGMAENEAVPVAALTEQKKNWKKKLAHWIRLNLFIPDAKIGWIPFAVKTGKKIIKREKPDLIFSSSPPPTVHLIARKLAKWSKLKWVADFRDPWTEIHYYPPDRNYLSRNLDKKLESGIISDCTAAICASSSFIDLLTKNNKDKFFTITNGYDLKINEKNRTENGKINITYTGGLTNNRYYEKLFTDISSLIRSKPELKELLQINIIGEVDNLIRNSINDIFSELNIIHFIGYVEHSQALEFVKNSDILLLFLEKKENYTGHIPAKLFEYITSGNYILGIGPPNGDAAGIIAQTGTGKVYSPQHDFAAIVEKLIADIKNKTEKSVNWKEIKKYSRKELTKQLAARLDAI
ncbi:MAG: hypothetical protein APR54_02295 [Candidatus Cloacimonas sp. SDB]|nr:MAG: hypothetical protein APR54_02295 [Candidatus Cloacimonas sp. SDB]